MESSFKSYSLCELSGHESSGSMPAGKTKNKTTSRRRSVAAIYLKKLIPRVKLIKTQTLPVTKTTKIEEPEFKNQLEKLMISKQTVLDRVHQFLLNENSRNEAIKLPEDASTSSSKSSPSSKSSLKTSFETEEESSTKELRELNISKSSSHRTSDELPLGIIASHSKASNSGPKTDIIKNLTTNKMVVVNPEIHDRILESPKINFSISCKNEDIILQDKLVPTSVIVKTIQNDHNIQKSVNTAISQINSSEITNIKHTDSCSPQLTEKKTLDDAKRKKYFFEATNNATEVDNVSSDSSVNSICARECLQKGVEAHQNDDMINSARWFEQSAKKDGGCGMGMLMWALSLRHGWGCEIDKVKAYGWLQMAAENLLLELNHLSLKRDSYANFRPQESVLSFC
ncbi:hypothetical protein BY996DRAFT_3355897 [Phakopsora pachyrhizi]|nr:hypothetical protein BY996DRAFT_3355897 [Phakopsora pachyrhizi]